MCSPSSAVNLASVGRAAASPPGRSAEARVRLGAPVRGSGRLPHGPERLVAGSGRAGPDEAASLLVLDGSGRHRYPSDRLHYSAGECC